MSYYHPQIEAPGSEGLTMTPCELTLEKVDRALLIFDLPSEIAVYIDDTPLPSSVFDYYNPLLIDPVGLGSVAKSPENSTRHGKILFYHLSDLSRASNFSCYTLNVDPVFLRSILQSTIHYPPNFYIDYRNLRVTRSARAKQLCDLFERIHEEPPESSAIQLFESMFRPSLQNIALIPPRINTTLFFEFEDPDSESEDS